MPKRKENFAASFLSQPNKNAIEIMAKDGIDISNHTSNNIEEYKNTEISHVLTVCDHANESCPVYLKKVNLTHQNFSDPSKVIGNELEIQNAFEKCREVKGSINWGKYFCRKRI